MERLFCRGNIHPGEYIPYLSPFYFNSIRWLSLERVSATRNRHLQWNFVFNFNSDRCVVRISHRFKHRKTLYERESICFIVNLIVITVLMHIFGNVHLWIICYTQYEIIEICFVIDLFFFFFFNFDNAIYRENKMKIIKWWQIRFFFFQISIFVRLIYFWIGAAGKLIYFWLIKYWNFKLWILNFIKFLRYKFSWYNDFWISINKIHIEKCNIKLIFIY